MDTLGVYMVKNTKLKNVTKEDLLYELNHIIRERNLTTITQREYFSLSRFSDFVLKKLGINFNSLKEELGISVNFKGKKARTLAVEEPELDKGSVLSFENPIKKEYTGKEVTCLKCTSSFKQSNLFHRICESCAAVNKQTTEGSSMFW